MQARLQKHVKMKTDLMLTKINHLSLELALDGGEAQTLKGYIVYFQIIMDVEYSKEILKKGVPQGTLLDPPLF